MSEATNSSSIKQLYSSVITSVDDDFDDFEPLKKLAERFNLNPAHVVIGIVVFISLFTLATTLLSHVLITVFAMIYPSYMSFKVKLFLCRPFTEARMT